MVASDKFHIKQHENGILYMFQEFEALFKARMSLQLCERSVSPGTITIHYFAFNKQTIMLVLKKKKLCKVKFNFTFTPYFRLFLCNICNDAVVIEQNSQPRKVKYLTHF